MEYFRCVHADRIALDHQLRGTGPMTGEARRVVEDATFIAFEKVVDSCLAHKADCLLLTGDSIDPESIGLRGPAALVRGILRLAERDIAVVLDAGRASQWSSWPAGLRFPPNAHRLGPGFENSVSVARQGHLLATITAADPLARRHETCPGWQIQLSEVQGSTSTFPVEDTPRSVQGFHAQENGPQGCVLVEFESGAAPRQTIIPTAPVRWERFDMTLNNEMNRDDLLQEMATVIERAGRKPCEKVWLVSWTVSGAGPLFESLAEKRFRDGLIAELVELDPLPGIALCTPAIEVHTSSPSSRPIGDHDELAADFLARLDERLSRHETARHECLAGSALHGGPWEMKLEALLAELDAGETAREAGRMTRHWFAVPEELSS
jgi:hypothetical protein